MPNRLSTTLSLFCSIALPVLLVATSAAQTAPASPASATRIAKPAPAPLQAAAPSEKDVQAARHELLRLLRVSPTMTTVIAHDPSLLADQEYVARNNPELAQFLSLHPEIARNPDFYLFTHPGPGDEGPDEALERAVWPEYSGPRGDSNVLGEFLHDLAPLLAFACFLGAAMWLTRTFVENRRWSRMVKLQTDVHGRLIDKFSSTQELAAYMQTEAGRRFLEAAPIPVGFEAEQRVPNALARVLTPVQIGVVMILLGAGLLSLRHVSPDSDVPFLILGTVVIMPGIGFIISAGITWILAGRLGLMPQPSARRTNLHSDSLDQQ